MADKIENRMTFSKGPFQVFSVQSAPVESGKVRGTLPSPWAPPALPYTAEFFLGATPSPFGSSGSWPSLTSSQAVFQEQGAANESPWASATANTTAALEEIQDRIDALNYQLTNNPTANSDLIAAALAQCAREQSFINTELTKIATGHFSDLIPTVYTLENAHPFIGGGTF